MGMIRFNITAVLLLLNIVPLFAVYGAVNAWIRPKSRPRIVLICVGVLVLVLNIPISLFWFRSQCVVGRTIEGGQEAKSGNSG